MINYIRRIRYKKRQKNQKDYINSILEVTDFKPIKNVKPVNKKKITFVIPGMSAFSGGHTSILRLGTELVSRGYDVFYMSFFDQPLEEMKHNAEVNLKQYKGKIIATNLDNYSCDIIVATSWDSVYFVKNMNGYKMYFVQDYEPYFHLYGELFLMAKKTYELGLHMVSLGGWNKYMIEKNCSPISPVDEIEFPYEGKEYYDKGRDFDTYKNKDEFNFAVYLKDTGKRAPYLIQYLMKNVKEYFEKMGKKINIKYYGETTDFDCDGGENLGKLNKEQLFNLYSESDFGVVASLTNISLVPYEMLATGLPIIELEDGTFSHFFPENSCILTGFDSSELIDKLEKSISDVNSLKEMSKKAKNYLETLSWSKSAEQFIKVIEKI